MNLSRAAKKFREAEEPKESKKKAAAKKTPAPAPASKPVKPAEIAKAPEPIQEPKPTPSETPEPATETPAELESVKKKRPRFVFVRQKSPEQLPESSKLPTLPQPSKKVFAKLMSKNLALPPKEEPTKVLRG